MRVPRRVVVVLCCCVLGSGLAQRADWVGAKGAAAGRIGRARAAAAALEPLYDRETGLFRTTGWWNSANGVTALADESRVTGDTSLRWIFPDVFERAPRKFAGFLNEYYDDEGWWGAGLDRGARPGPARG